MHNMMTRLVNLLESSFKRVLVVMTALLERKNALSSLSFNMCCSRVEAMVECRSNTIKCQIKITNSERKKRSRML